MAKKTIVSEVASAVGTAAGVAAARVEGLKPKRSATGKHTKARVAAPVAVDPTEVAQLAYLHWEARAGRDGSPEQDWIRAEQELLTKAAGR